MLHSIAREGVLPQVRTVTLIKGDGIGPEISQAVMDIFQAAQVRGTHYTCCRPRPSLTSLGQWSGQYSAAGACGVGECQCGTCEDA